MSECCKIVFSSIGCSQRQPQRDEDGEVHSHLGGDHPRLPRLSRAQVQVSYECIGTLLHPLSR